MVNKLPNRVTISGHTSASADGAKPSSDWALSSSRADASRQILQSAGPTPIVNLPGGRQSRVRSALHPDDPMLPGNRRITIVLLREAPVLPPNPAL